MIFIVVMDCKFYSIVFYHVLISGMESAGIQTKKNGLRSFAFLLGPWNFKPL